MIRTLRLPGDRGELTGMLRRLRLDAGELALLRGERAERARVVAATIGDVAERGDAALVEQARKFDDPDFEASKLTVTKDEMAAAAGRVDPTLLKTLRKSIAQVREYQAKIMPAAPAPLERAGFRAGLRWTAIDAAGLYFPGGKASYPSSLIMLAVPAQVAGVRRVVACTPPSRHFSDAVLAVGHELGITELYRVGGVAAIAAMALGTETIKPVDKLLGPGNEYVQLAKRAVSGAVGVDGFFGPSEVLVIADESADAATIAADMLAQAEHDPGSCFLATTSESLAAAVVTEVGRQAATLPRGEALRRSFENYSAVVLCRSDEEVLEVSNTIACEHVSLRVREDREDAWLAGLRHAGCVFVGKHSPVAAGDYLAGPSHCLPTNTTARFESGVSVYTFLKRTSVVKYGAPGIDRDAPDIATFARAEGLEGHARSAEIRVNHP